jgi:hypothetical protein
MPATITQIADGLKTRLATISGLRTFNYQPEQINPPIGFPVLEGIKYHGAFAGGDVVTDWSVVVIVGRYTDARAFVTLDDYLSYSGAKSVRAALEGDLTLGGVVSTMMVSNGASISPESQEGAEFLMVRFTCQVHG